MKTPPNQKLYTIALIGLLAAGVGYLTWGAKPPNSAITLTEARAVPVKGEPGAVRIYLQISNSGAPDRLIAAHSSKGEALLYSPEATRGPAIPLGRRASLAADGAHVKLSGLDTPEDGQLIALSLEFENAGRTNVQARVDDPEAIGDAGRFGLFGVGDICIVEDGEPAPEITLEAVAEDDAVMLRVIANEFTFSQDMMGSDHVPGMGHGHLYLDGLKLERLFEPEARIEGLPKGEHILRVTLNTNDHRAYVVDDEPVTASISVTIN